MQQWIPRTQTLEPKIWGQVGLRQGLYMGLGVFAGLFFLVALAPFGIGPRIVAALMSLAGGATVGFIKIKGLSPERYVFHRLRFAVRRQGVGVWQVSHESLIPLKNDRQKPVPKAPALCTVPVSLSDRIKWAFPGRNTPIKRSNERVAEVTPFGMWFEIVALGMMGVAAIYVGGAGWT